MNNLLIYNKVPIIFIKKYKEYITCLYKNDISYFYKDKKSNKFLLVKINQNNSNGIRMYKEDNILHREDGPAIEFTIVKTKIWYQNGILHREDGPAIEDSSGTREWFQNNKRHRLNGPAIEYVNGKKYWHIEGINYSEEQFLNEITRKKLCL